MNENVGLAPPPTARKCYMPVREIRTRLEALRLSQWRESSGDAERIPLAALADFVDCDDSMLRKIVLGYEPLSARMQIGLDAAFRLIDARMLRFERNGQQWRAVRSDMPPPGQPSRRYAVVLKRGSPALSLNYQPADTSRSDFFSSFERIKDALMRR